MRLFAALALAALTAGCASVNRVDPNTVTDLSGSWNDTDSRLVAEQMITECLSRSWLPEFQAARGGKPVLMVGTVRNRSQEHISAATFTKDLERELINSGRVRFVTSKEERAEVREEKLDQQENASAETMKRVRQETGADFMIIGNIEQMDDRSGGTTAKAYQVNLELINLESNEKAWIASKKIKKMVKKSFLGL